MSDRTTADPNAMSVELTADLTKLAQACRILEMEGHGDMTLGHLSYRDPDGRGFWMKRNAAGLGEIMGPQDFVLMSYDGKKLAGTGNNHSEWPIHSEILRARPDIVSVAHTHAWFSSLFTATDAPLRPVAIDGTYFKYPLPRFDATAALIKNQDLGGQLAKALGPDHYAVFLGNHGVAFCGTSIEHCAMVGVFLERACKAFLTMSGAGVPWIEPDEATQDHRRGETMTPVHISHSWNYFVRKLEARTRGAALYS